MSDNGFLTTQEKKDMIRWLKRSIEDEKKGIQSHVFFVKIATQCGMENVNEIFSISFENQNKSIAFLIKNSYENFIKNTESILNHAKQKKEYYDQLKIKLQTDKRLKKLFNKKIKKPLKEPKKRKLKIDNELQRQINEYFSKLT